MAGRSTATRTHLRAAAAPADCTACLSRFPMSILRAFIMGHEEELTFRVPSVPLPRTVSVPARTAAPSCIHPDTQKTCRTAAALSCAPVTEPTSTNGSRSAASLVTEAQKARADRAAAARIAACTSAGASGMLSGTTRVLSGAARATSGGNGASSSAGWASPVVSTVVR
ncbi:hypothetical protein BCR43DRAFT_508957 [Syncephalastrum racemosum]|uniref:Uncharacterized protein n=1 Tax=Syncephalastrum racemosum TaxID=13706 RepID=A0A1X2H070_SYNRA|nr:hypothetical protein BCR43DRAFT_508957 [Syncephalastrum racemosum]